MKAWSVTGAIALQTKAHDEFVAAENAGKLFHFGQTPGKSFSRCASLRGAVYGAYSGWYVWTDDEMIGKKVGKFSIRRDDGSILKV